MKGGIMERIKKFCSEHKDAIAILGSGIGAAVLTVVIYRFVDGYRVESGFLFDCPQGCHTAMEVLQRNGTITTLVHTKP
jgi:hypothetical protein